MEVLEVTTGKLAELRQFLDLVQHYLVLPAAMGAVAILAAAALADQLVLVMVVEMAAAAAELMTAITVVVAAVPVDIQATVVMEPQAALQTHPGRLDPEAAVVAVARHQIQQVEAVAVLAY